MNHDWKASLNCILRQYSCLAKIAIMSMYGLSFIGCDTPNHDNNLRDSNNLTDQFTSAMQLTAEEILDPKSCQPCHPIHYEQWQASMHAYASDDPVFLALNQKGQRETNGELGSFCIQCHAPLAFKLGYTTDGLNLSELPNEVQGITCAFCHMVSDIAGTHNNPLVWSEDQVMRGGIKNPLNTIAHTSVYSSIHDGKKNESSDLCGSCHDIVTPLNVHLERSYWEWKSSLFNDEDPLYRNTCNSCHMPTRPGKIAVNSVNENQRIHDHIMPGVDVHLEDHKHRDVLMRAVQQSLNGSLIGEICVRLGESSGAEVELYLENIAAGHRFPSGAALDRRLWVSLKVFDEQNQILFMSGKIEEHDSLLLAMEEQTEEIWAFFDKAYNIEGQATHNFWDISSVTRNTLPAPTRLPPTDPNYEEPHVMHRYRFATTAPIHHMEMKVFIRPLPIDLIEELIDNGDLAADVLEFLPTFELKYAARYWDLESAKREIPLSGKEALCVQ
jgi:hypothetical protein